METRNLQQMLMQVKKMQEQMQKQIDDLEVEASSGGGMVVVKMNGQKQLRTVRIDPEVMKTPDLEMLQDLVLAAVNEASRKVDEELSSRMGNLTGGLGGLAGLKIPGLF